MKKIKILLLLIICMFVFKYDLYAFEPTIVCPSEVDANTVFECEVKTDVKVNIVTGLYVFKGSTTMDSNGVIKFKSSESGIFDISLLSYDYTNTFNTTTVNVKKVTTEKATTTKAKSSNNYLSSILVNGNKIEGFSKDKTKYFINVSYDVEKILIDAKVEDITATYEVNGPKTLEVGENEYTIGTTSEDNVTKFYKVIVTREEKEESSNTKISNIKIKGYKLNFDGNSKTYHLTVKKDLNKLNIDVSLDDENAVYEISGNDNLKDGSIIKITVTAENEDSSVYRIIITKQQESNYLLYIVTAIGVSIIAIILIIVILNKNKKNNRKQKTKENGKNKNNDNDLEKTITISNDTENEITNEINNDDLEKTKIMNLNDEIGKAFKDNDL